MGFVRNPGQRGDIPEPSGGPAVGEHTLLGFTPSLILDLNFSRGWVIPTGNLDRHVFSFTFFFPIGI